MRVYDDGDVHASAAWLADPPAGDGPSNTEMVKAYVGGTSSALISIAKLLTQRA